MNSKQEVIAYIEQRIAKAIEVARTWPDDRKFMRIKCSNPEIRRTLEDWLFYGSAGAEDRNRVRTQYSAAEQDEAIEAIMWLFIPLRHLTDKERQIVCCIMGLRIAKLDDKGFGYRDISFALLRFGFKRSHMTVKRRYDEAMDKIYKHLKENL